MEITNVLPEKSELTKSFIELNAQIISGMVSNGELYPIETDIKLKALEEIIDQARKLIKPKVIAELEKNKEKEYFGVQVAVTGGRTTLDYESDAEYAVLKKRLAERKEMLDSAYKMAQKGGTYLIEETSEVVEAPPVKNYGEDSIKYTFSKK